MRQLVVLVALAGVALAMPQGAAVRDNTFTKILSYESYQDGHNFGHELFQEDGTSAGQKFGPDGLLYGFYSYLQDDGNRVKVLWRAGQGVGYEVIGVEGLNEENLGNLRATVSTNPTPRPAVRAAAAPQPLHHQRPQQQHRPAAPARHRVPVVPAHRSVAPVIPAHQNRYMPTPSPIMPHEPTPSPHRFDYPAVLNLERTGTGFVSSLTAL